MTNISAKIIFFGTEDFSLTTLQALLDAGYPIEAVVTKPDSKKGRGQYMTPSSVKVLASQYNIPVWQPSALKDIRNDIMALGPVLGVLVSYGKIIPQSIIDLFTPGIINVHPSLLPKYRGPSPIESAIRNGDSTTGVTIMQLSAAMDAGPIYSVKQYNLTGVETQPELYRILGRIGANLLLETLPGIIDDSLKPTPQLDSDATYCSLLEKSDSLLNLKKLDAASAERTIRAHLDFPKTRLVINNHSIIITKAHTSDTQKTPLDLLCQNGAYLCIDELIAPSGRRMSASDFLRGYAV